MTLPYGDLLENGKRAPARKEQEGEGQAHFQGKEIAQDGRGIEMRTS